MDLDRLEALAKASPMPGPWEVAEGRTAPAVLEPRPDGFKYVVAQMVNAGPKVAAYLAAADPQTVLQLIRELRAARIVVTYAGRGDQHDQLLRNALDAYGATPKI